MIQFKKHLASMVLIRMQSKMQMVVVVILSLFVLRSHRDINFDAKYMDRLLDVLLNLGYKIDTDWRPVRIELYSDELGYLDIHPFVLNEDGTSKQADLEGGWYEFEKDYFSSAFFEEKNSVYIFKRTKSFSFRL